MRSLPPARLPALVSIGIAYLSKPIYSYSPPVSYSPPLLGLFTPFTGVEEGMIEMPNLAGIPY